MRLIKIQEAAALFGLSAYELRQGIHEGRYPGFWTRNRKRVLVDPEALKICIREEMEQEKQAAKAAYQEVFPGGRG